MITTTVLRAGRSAASLLCSTALAVLTAGSAEASTTFQFRGNLNTDAGQTVTGLATAAVTTGGFTATLEASPSGAVLDESDNRGLGIDSAPIPGVSDGDNQRLNVLGGTGPLAGERESVTLSFDRSGVITDLFFDGVKDETLEYFTVTMPDASFINFFDFEAEFRLNQQGFVLADLGLANIVLAGDDEDDLRGVALPFGPGDEFTIAYGEIDFVNLLPGYVPLEGGSGNGARFAGVTVIPEAGCLALACAAAGPLLVRREGRCLGSRS